MSTISSVRHPPLGYVAPIPVDSPTVSSSFSQTFSVAQAPKSLLTTAETSHANRPNVKEFMDRSGAPFLDASELIYGVVGSNTDVRDWSSIMASDEPISAARRATGQMYGRTDITPRTDATYIGASDTLAKEGNFAVRLLKDKDNKVVDQGLKLIDAQGLLLRDAGSSPEVIARNAWLFGLDTQPLVKLAQAATIVSADLGRAVQQASISAPAANEAAAVSHAPVLTMGAENVNLLSLTGSTAQTTPPAEVEPVAAAQKDDQATSPSLEEVLQEVAASAFKYVDSTTVLNNLFGA